MDVKEVLLDPRVLDSLTLARENIVSILKKYESIDVYTDILKETIEDLDKIRFLIGTLRMEEEK